jgi:hypothetical protein
MGEWGHAVFKACFFSYLSISDCRDEHERNARIVEWEKTEEEALVLLLFPSGFDLESFFQVRTNIEQCIK